MPSYKELPLLTLKSQAQFEAWLQKQQARQEGAWLKFAKKASKQRSITYVEAREAAIIYGWIDGLINAFDEDYSVRRFTPRRKRSKWSEINRDIAQQLIDEGRMAPSGLLQVDAAKADGRWVAAYPSASKMALPEDLKSALKRNPKAGAAFQVISGANRYSILYAIHDAKRSDTRKRRIDKYVNMLAAGEL